MVAKKATGEGQPKTESERWGVLVGLVKGSWCQRKWCGDADGTKWQRKSITAKRERRRE